MLETGTFSTVLDAVKDAAGEYNIFLYGPFLHSCLAFITPKPVRLDFIVAYTDTFDVNRFYTSLTKTITISEQIENTPEVYHIISPPFELYFSLQKYFIPEIFSATQNFNVDGALYNLKTDECLSCFSPPITVKGNIAHWTLMEVLDLLVKANNLNAEIDPQNIEVLSNLKLREIGTANKNQIFGMLMCLSPGTLFKKIVTIFVDGDDWLMDELMSTVIEYQIPINEEVSRASVLNDEKFNLIDVYNAFSLSHKDFETPENKTQRLTSTLRLLFDSPSLSIPEPYIERIAVLSSKLKEQKKEIEVFSDCPYPPCTCDPAKCLPHCCCCSSSYIVNQVKLRCHDKVLASCNQDGTAPGPNENPFPGSCTHCGEMCDMVSGRTPGLSCTNLPYQSWWDISDTPVRCDCKQWNGENCELYCVYQVGGKCLSNAEVTGSNCSFRISLTPSGECCDSSPILETFAAKPELSLAETLTEPLTLETFSTCKVHGTADYYFSSSETETQFGQAICQTDAWGTDNVFKASLDPAVSGISIQQVLVNSNDTSATYQINVTVAASVSNGIYIGKYDLFCSGGGTSTQVASISVSRSTRTTDFPKSCQCLDSTPIPVLRDAPECKGDNPAASCYDFPIEKCLPGQQCNCDNITSVTVCGTTISIIPTDSVLVCCSELDFGCTCGGDDCPVQQCCGPDCAGSQICDSGLRLYHSLKDAQNAVWCQCWTESAYVETAGCTDCCCPDLQASPGDPSYPCDQLDPNNPEHQTLLTQHQCCSCPSSNADICCNTCQLAFHDGNCGYFSKTRSEINQQVEQAWIDCTSGSGGGNPPASLSCPDMVNCIADEHIAATDGCTLVRNPAVAVLNNGIGLVAYEEVGSGSVICIKQFKTSSKAKIFANRILNFGRLENPSGWSVGDTYYAPKIYYFEDINTNRLSD